MSTPVTAWKILKMLLLSYYKRQGKQPVEGKMQEDQHEIYDMTMACIFRITLRYVGYSRLRRFGNNQTLKPDAVNIVIDLLKETLMSYIWSQMYGVKRYSMDPIEGPVMQR